MHSTVYQITRKKIDHSDFISQHSLAQGDGYYIDYCSEVSPDERQRRISVLVDSILPHDMFTVVDADTIRYEGGIDEWIGSWVSSIHSHAALVTPENVVKYADAPFQLLNEVRNPLHVDNLFYLYEDRSSLFAERSDELIRLISTLSVGDCLHIGGVLDFRF